MACVSKTRSVFYKFIDPSGVNITNEFTSRSLPSVLNVPSNLLSSNFNFNVPGLSFGYIASSFPGSEENNMVGCNSLLSMHSQSATLDWGSSVSGLGISIISDWLHHFGSHINNPEPTILNRARLFIDKWKVTFVYVWDGMDNPSPRPANIKNILTTEQIFSTGNSNSNSVPFSFIINEDWADVDETRLQSAFYLSEIIISVDLHEFHTLNFTKTPNNVGGILNYPGNTIWRINHFQEAEDKIGAGVLSHSSIILEATPPVGYRRKIWTGNVTSSGTSSGTSSASFINEVDISSFTAIQSLSADIEFEETSSHRVTLEISPPEALVEVAIGGEPDSVFSLNFATPSVSALVEEKSGINLHARSIDEGWAIVSWHNADDPNSTSSVFSIARNFVSNITSPTTVTVLAELSDILYAIRHKGGGQNDHGTILVNASDVGNFGSFTGKLGDSFNLKFIPDENYRVKSLSGSLVDITGGATNEIVTKVFTIDTNNNNFPRQITVEWETASHTVTILQINGNGSISPSASTFTVFHGEVVSLLARPSVGWEVSGWTGTDRDNKKGSHAKAITNVATITSDTTIQVSFSQSVFVINASVSGGGGTISPSSRTAVFGETAQFTATPTPGSGLSVTGWQGTVLDSKRSISTESPVINSVLVNGYKNVFVFFEEIISRVFILTEVSSGNGTITGGGEFPQGSTVVFTATPAPGWSVAGWANTNFNNTGGDGEIVTDETIADRQKRVTVTFEKVSFMVTGKVLQGEGTICVKKTPLLPCQSVIDANINSVVTFTATPDPGWSVARWTNAANANVIGSEGLTVDNTTPVIVGDMTLGVHFNQDLVSVSASVGLGISYGSISPEIQQVVRGKKISVTATPSAGWRVASWKNSIDDSKSGLNGQPISNAIVANNDTNNIIVNFVEVDSPMASFSLGVSIASEQGNRGSLITTSGSHIAGTVVILEAIANPGFVISNWDGADQRFFNQVTMNADKTVILYFSEQAELPIEGRFITAIEEGNGWIRPSSGSYELGSKVIFTAGSFPGSKFVKWQSEESDADLNLVGDTGTQLEVSVSSDKVIVAEFEDISGFEPLEENIFYCASSKVSNGIISFNHTNTEDTESTISVFHYKLIFYSDINKTNFVSTVSTSNDVRNWYTEKDVLSIFPVSGEELVGQGTVKVIYNPEVNPLKNINQKRDNGTTQPSLQCGVEYTVDIEVVDELNNTTLLQTVVFSVPCEEVDGHFWRKNSDSDNWICSGQGKDDLMVSFSGIQSLFPHISSNQFGLFLIAWQSRRDTSNSIYGAIWDSKNDKLFSSGQGLYDKLYLPVGFKPKVLTDQAQNFYISTHNINKIFSYKCSLPLSISGEEPDMNVFDSFCYPGLDTLLDVDPRDILIRVYEEDLFSSIVVDKDRVMPVVTKQNIRIDVSGIQGAYAVRIRNSDDEEWGDFINIDVSLYDNPDNINFPTLDDDNIDAYFIGNDRFLVPWDLKKINGIRRVCLQILTFYGISNTVCLDVLSNLETLSYRIDYYFDEELTIKADEFSGFPILTEQKDIDGVPLAETTTVYIKVTFSEKQRFADGEIKFNVFQQGLGDQYNIPLNVLNEEGIYTGSFEIRKHDGIFNKDGLGFVNIAFPNDPFNIENGCFLDQSDRLNILLSTKSLPVFVESGPRNVLEKDKSGIINKVLNINEFKQFYNKDDVNSRFGSPDVFKED